MCIRDRTIHLTDGWEINEHADISCKVPNTGAFDVPWSLLRYLPDRPGIRGSIYDYRIVTLAPSHGLAHVATNRSALLPIE